MSTSEDTPDIAIIGLACRFPGARNPAEFWRNLADGVESISRLSDEEILQSGAPQSHLKAPNYVKAAPVLEDPGAFDAGFFGFTPNEARTMDPQHRTLLELAFEALEDAGCDPAQYPGRIGSFMGAAMNTYFMHAGLNRDFAEDYIPTLIVNDKDFLSTRLSYKLNLKGPSVTVQTACSTSLVAVHFARQSLLLEESDIALAGAISVRVPHRAGYFADAGGITSPDGHVRAFDAGANGTVFGSGGGIVVLKRLHDALADGDTIRAIIRGSAINNDGADKAGYTAPSVDSQADSVIEALANADADAESITYLEAHGSGTPVGDPIEIRALTKAFRASTDRSGFCAIGSVKTNVGHLDAAAGMAGLIKTVLALQHRQIPASLNFTKANPEIDFAATPFFVNTQLLPWASPQGPRRAGIMATGMGGTNAHVVLEEAPNAPASKESSQPSLLLLSARTETALTASADRWREYLEQNLTVPLDDAAFTSQTGRRAMEHRRFVVAADRAGALANLTQKPSRFQTGQVTPGRHPVILLLPGVGDHYVGMGRELYLAFPAFRREVDRCSEILQPLLGLDIRDILYPKHRDWRKSSTSQGIDLKKMLAGNTQPPDDEDTRRLNQVEHLQPALFTIEFALARLWLDLGIVPQAIVGHSMGEYVAACLSGVFSLEDALRLVVRRTQLVAPLPSARMLAVTLSESELQPLLPTGLSLALINGPRLCIVAGPPETVDEFTRTLTARGVLHRPVQNTHAFHSRLLEPIVPAFVDEVRKVRLNAPGIPFVSNVTGRWITTADATDPAYWGRHVNHTARFHDALQTLWQMEDPLLLEAGPGRTLGVLSQQHPAKPKDVSTLAISSLRHHYENQPDPEVLLTAIGRLWLAGSDIHWKSLYPEIGRRHIPLPTYPFERSLYWMEPRNSAESVGSSAGQSESGPLALDHWFHVPSWERTAPPANIASQASQEGILWLIFSDRDGRDHGFRGLLAQSGGATKFVRCGQTFHHGADGTCEIDPRRAEDYLALFREIKDAPWTALHVLHLGCLGSSDATSSVEASQDSGFFSLMQIAQAIGETNLTAPVRIAVISSGIHQVIGHEELNPLKSTVLGPCGVIPKEFPNITCVHIDLACSAAAEDLDDRHRQWILSEFAEPFTEEGLAYRGPHRWRRKFVPVALPSPPPPDASPRTDRLRERGVYLITGGTGGLGLAVARHLALTCRARLVLTKKNPFPEKSQWKDILAREDASSDLAQTLRQLLEIETLGGEVEVLTADVADLEAMRMVIRETNQKFQQIHGVIHAAGFVRAGLIQAVTRKLADEILSPKVRGTLVLHELLKDSALDFLVLFSSMASITGPFAHAEYSAANAFLDAFAAYANSQANYPTLTINWPVWKEVGIVAKLEKAMGVEDWKDEALKKAILTRDGLEAFQRILRAGLPQVIVSPEDLDQALAQAKVAPSTSGNTARRRSADSAGASGSEADQPTDEIESTVAGVWSHIFGLERIGIHEQFTSLGGHSLLALQIVARLRSVYHVELSLRDFFEAPTIAEFSALIQDKIIRDIESMSDDEVRQLMANEPLKHD